MAMTATSGVGAGESSEPGTLNGARVGPPSQTPEPLGVVINPLLRLGTSPLRAGGLPQITEGALSSRGPIRLTYRLHPYLLSDDTSEKSLILF